MSKYRSKRTNGYSSAKEADYAVILHALERSGKIWDLVEQPVYVLIPAITLRSGKKQRAMTYVSDFAFTDENGRQVHDTKGFKTPVYMLKKKLFHYFHPTLEITEI